MYGLHCGIVFHESMCTLNSLYVEVIEAPLEVLLLK